MPDSRDNSSRQRFQKLRQGVIFGGFRDPQWGMFWSGWIIAAMLAYWVGPEIAVISGAIVAAVVAIRQRSGRNISSGTKPPPVS